MKWLYALFFTTVFTSVAHAEKTQFFFQPDKGEHIIEPGIGIKAVNYDLPAGEIRSLSTFIGGSYQYGFLESFSAGVTAGFASTTTTVDPDDFLVADTSSSGQGLTDITFTLKGRSVVGDGVTLRYGGDLSFSPEPAKYDANGYLDNEMSGENILAPYIGIDFLIAEKHRVGGQIQRDIPLGKQVDESSTGQKTKYQGAEETSIFAFYEYQWSQGLVGGGFGHQSVGKRETEAGAEISESYEFFTSRAYANFQTGPNWTLVPQIGAQSFIGDSLNGSKIDSYTIFTTTFSARYSF